MKQKMIEFLELEKKAKKFNPYTHENYLELITFYSKALTIAPLAVRELLEAKRLIQRLLNNRAIPHIFTEVAEEAEKFLEDFENEN